MKQHIGYISALVRDYDEAIAYYTKTLGFRLIQDTPVDEQKRWVLVAPPGSAECRLLLARATKPEEISAIGRQAGGRVFLFLHTVDFGGTTARSQLVEFASVRNRARRLMGLSQYSATYMVIVGTCFS